MEEWMDVERQINKSHKGDGEFKKLKKVVNYQGE
jgi:hypothetical protein